MRNFIKFLAFLSLLGFAHQTLAARLYFDVPQKEFKVGESIPVKILVNTEGEEINAVSLKFNYPKDLLSLESTSNANSIINFWAKFLVGVVVGGYKGNQGLISQFNFKALNTGIAEIAFAHEVEMYLNDGLGTPVKIDLANPIRLVIVPGPTSPPLAAPIDKDPPEDFTPIIARSPDVFDNQYFLAFSTQDKGSGVDRYETQENRQRKPSATAWRVTNSPYLLTDQTLSSYIFVKAVDGAGNERIVGLRPKSETVEWSFPWWFWLLIILVIIVIVFAIIIIRRHRSAAWSNK